MCLCVCRGAESGACRDYNVGEAPEAATLAAAAEAGLAIPPGTAARQFDPETDIVRADLVLVMDKFTAADVLREARCPPCAPAVVRLRQSLANTMLTANLEGLHS